MHGSELFESDFQILSRTSLFRVSGLNRLMAGLDELGKQSSSSEANESLSDVIVTKLVAISIRLVLDDNFDGNRRVGLVFPDMKRLQGGGRSKAVRRRPESIKMKQDWQERFKNIRFRKKEVQESDKTNDPTMPTSYFCENLFITKRGVLSRSSIPRLVECHGILPMGIHFSCNIVNLHVLESCIKCLSWPGLGCCNWFVSTDIDDTFCLVVVIRNKEAQEMF
ncbi:hypothetical protein Tco_0629975 [Tanacetum coccineum]|uniref:Uncharacterized protein n=1 Tax=Tanacetum coccineum TaxID=301880 RepID=A0ABQ4WUY4_9ASTR